MFIGLYVKKSREKKKEKKVLFDTKKSAANVILPPFHGVSHSCVLQISEWNKVDNEQFLKIEHKGKRTRI